MFLQRCLQFIVNDTYLFQPEILNLGSKWMKLFNYGEFDPGSE